MNNDAKWCLATIKEIELEKGCSVFSQHDAYDAQIHNNSITETVNEFTTFLIREGYINMTLLFSLKNALYRRFAYEDDIERIFDLHRNYYIGIACNEIFIDDLSLEYVNNSQEFKMLWLLKSNFVLQNCLPIKRKIEDRMSITNVLYKSLLK